MNFSDTFHSSCIAFFLLTGGTAYGIRPVPAGRMREGRV